MKHLSYQQLQKLRNFSAAYIAETYRIDQILKPAQLAGRSEAYLEAWYWARYHNRYARTLHYFQKISVQNELKRRRKLIGSIC